MDASSVFHILYGCGMVWCVGQNMQDLFGPFIGIAHIVGLNGISDNLSARSVVACSTVADLQAAKQRRG